MSTPRIVLASQSPRRRQLLALIGIPHEVEPADVDESVGAGEPPHVYVERLARDKALTVARNLGQGRPTHFLAADFDMQRHYRPRLNVVQRPTRAGGAGYLLTGHHELLLPMLVWGVLEELGAA